MLKDYVGLRSKCYSLLFFEKLFKKWKFKERQKQTAKGTKKSVKKKHLRHTHYLEVVKRLKEVYVRGRSFLIFT